MREKIERKLAAIRKSIGERGMSDGTEIATKEEIRWLIEQTAKYGIMLSFTAEPNTWQQEDRCYYYYTALSIKADKKKVRDFVDVHPLLSVCALNSLLKKTDEPQEVENIKQMRRLIQARDARRRRRKRKKEQEKTEMEEQLRIDIEKMEAANHRNDLTWLVERIESMGWEVTLRRKIKEQNNITESK